VVQSDEHTAQIHFAFGKKANVVDESQINQIRFRTIVLIEMLQNDFRQETRAEGTLRNTVELVDAAISRRPLAQTATQKIAEVLFAAELCEEMAQYAVVNAIVKSCEIEAGAINESPAKGVPRRLVKCGVPIAPFLVKPLTGSASVYMAEGLSQIPVANSWSQSFRHYINERLIHNLVLNRQDGIRSKNS